MRQRAFIAVETEAVLEREEELERLHGRLLAKGPLPHQWAAIFARELETEAAAHAAGARGVPVSVDEAHLVLAGERHGDRENGLHEALGGYREARQLVGRWAERTAYQWGSDVLVSLHARVLGGNWPAGAGELATDPRSIVDRSTGAEIYNAPPAGDVDALLDEVFRRVAAWRGSVPLQSAWIHVALMAILPFREGNTAIAELMARGCLLRGGFRRPEFGSLESWWGVRSADYLAALRSLGGQFERSVDATAFVRAHLDEQIARVKELDARERALRQIWIAIENLVADAHLDSRLTEAVWHAFFGRTVTAGFYLRLVGTSTATATNDLRAAVAAGLLRGEGERRGRRYEAGEALESEVAASLALPGNQAGDRGEILRALYDRVGEARLASASSRL